MLTSSPQRRPCAHGLSSSPRMMKSSGKLCRLAHVELVAVPRIDRGVISAPASAVRASLQASRLASSGAARRWPSAGRRRRMPCVLQPPNLCATSCSAPVSSNSEPMGCPESTPPVRQFGWFGKRPVTKSDFAFIANHQVVTGRYCRDISELAALEGRILPHGVLTQPPGSICGGFAT